MANLAMDAKLTRGLLLIFLMFIVKTEAAAIACPEDTTQCNSTKTCIEYKYICDGDKDCEDGEDERNCEKKDSGCGDNSFKTDQTGSITSMNYPMNYTNLANCQWYISSPDNTTLQLEFADIFDTEKPRHDQCIYDFVSIYQMDPMLPIGRFCGAQSPGLIRLNSSKVLVEFQSDGQKTGHGFQLRWTSGNSTSYFTEVVTTPIIVTSTYNAQCRDQFEYGGDLGHISSPNFGQPYVTPLFCRWLIVVSPGYQISIQFSTLDVGESSVDGCVEGWLELYDGPDDGAPLIGKYCGDAMPAALTTSANVLYIVMSAGNKTSGKTGFKASYSSVYIELPSPTPPGPLPMGCDNTTLVIVNPSGYITSPFFSHGHPYLYGMDCEWILLAPEGQVFAIDFVEFELDQSIDCSGNYLRIYDVVKDRLPLSNETANVSLASENQTYSSRRSDGEANIRQIANLCGMMLPYSIETMTSSATIRFHSDAQYGGYGFNLTFHAKFPEVKCSSDQFKCDSLHCISLSSVCDGRVDCQGGVDEMLCLTLQCGLPAVQTEVVRIVGGTEAAEGAWPWTLSIVDKDRPGHICGATLIHPRWALSAAHCFERVFTRKYEQFALVSGRHDLLIPDPGEQWRFVEDVYMHREYFSGTSENDIALIKLKQPFSLSFRQNVLCLPQHRVTAGTPCYITGWGETLGTCCENKLKQALVPIINSTTCSGPDFYGDRLKDHMMCAGFPEGGVDTCDGDSGGPLACQTSTGNRHWELQGITSWGLLCASAKSPGVYTVVYDYITWIRQTVALNSI